MAYQREISSSLICMNLPHNNVREQKYYGFIFFIQCKNVKDFWACEMGWSELNLVSSIFSFLYSGKIEFSSLAVKI